MKFFSGSEPTMVTRINVVPIIDVSLVLVITLLVSAPILSAIDLGIDLPPARAQATPEEMTLVITLGKGGELAIGEDIVDRRDFVPRLKQRLAEFAEKDLLVVVCADETASHASVRDLLMGAREAGAGRIGIGTQYKSEDEQ